MKRGEHPRSNDRNKGNHQPPGGVSPQGSVTPAGAMSPSTLSPKSSQPVRKANRDIVQNLYPTGQVTFVNVPLRAADTNDLKLPGVRKNVPAHVFENGSEEKDPFEQVLLSAFETHNSQVLALKAEIQELKDRLGAVLMSNWSFAKDHAKGSTYDKKGDSPFIPLHLVTDAAFEKLEDIDGSHKTAIEKFNSNKDDASDQPPKQPPGLAWTVGSDEQKIGFMENSQKGWATFEVLTHWEHVEHVEEKEKVEEEYDEDPDAVAQALARQSDKVPPPSAGVLRYIIISPDDNKRLSWDLASTLLLLFDIILIPLNAFSLEENVFLVGLDWFTLCFWTCDVIASLITGYINKNGEIVMNPHAIAMAYLRGWFWLDLCVVVPDWVFTVLGLILDSDEGDGGAGSSARLLRMFRIMRVVRLLRLAKLQKIFRKLKDNIVSEKVFLAFHILQLLLVMVLVNHFLGSLWYMVGEIGNMNSGRNWISALDIRNRSLLYRYTISFQWALSHFTPGTTFVEATNSGERVFAIPVWLSGMVYTALMAASITVTMLQLQNANANRDRQFWLMRRYLRQNGVPSALNLRLLRYLEFKGKNSQEKIEESTLVILKNLSENLLQELKCAVNYGPLLRGHPVFAYLSAQHQIVTNCLSASAFCSMAFGEEEHVFRRATLATQMYWVVSGRLLYFKQDEHEKRICPGDHLSEMCLWTVWMHRADLLVTKQCSVVAVDCKVFPDIVLENFGAATVLAAYAPIFVGWLNNGMHTDMVTRTSTNTMSARLSDAMERRTSVKNVNKKASQCTDLIDRKSTDIAHMHLEAAITNAKEDEAAKLGIVATTSMRLNSPGQFARSLSGSFARAISPSK